VKYAWWTIVRAAIAASPKKRMTLAEVYDAVEARFEVFRNEPDEGWKVRGLSAMLSIPSVPLS